MNLLLNWKITCNACTAQFICRKTQEFQWMSSPLVMLGILERKCFFQLVESLIILSHDLKWANKKRIS